MRKILCSLTALAMSCSGSETTGPAGPPPVAYVTVGPPNAAVAVGSSLQLTVVLRDINFYILTNRTITFASSNEGVATVNTTGLVQGLAAGEATITATSEGKAGSVTLRVLLGDDCYYYYYCVRSEIYDFEGQPDLSRLGY
jgi:hypothetical protein